MVKKEDLLELEHLRFTYLAGVRKLLHSRESRGVQVCPVATPPRTPRVTSITRAPICCVGCGLCTVCVFSVVKTLRGRQCFKGKESVEPELPSVVGTGVGGQDGEALPEGVVKWYLQGGENHCHLF